MASDQDDRAQTLAAFTVSADDYRKLFASIDEGYCIGELVYDAAGVAIDVLYLEANASFRRLVRNDNPVGRTVRELYGQIEANWLATFEQVLETGESQRFESFSGGVDRWYDVYASRVGASESRRIAIVFYDITARKQAEISLRDGAERQAFLLKLSDALRAEPSAEAVANRALRMLSKQMGLNRCYVGIYRVAEDIAEFPHQVYDARLPPVPAEIRLSDFPEALKIAFDRTLVIDNVAENEGLSDSDRASIAALGMSAFVAATLRKGENNPLWAIVAGSMHPRAWTRGEVSLVEDVAERTWSAVERARAEAGLHESEARRELALEAGNMGTFIWHVEEDRGELDARQLVMFGQPPDGNLNLAEAMTLIHLDDAAGYAAAVTEATKPDGSRALRHDIRVQRPGGGWRWIEIRANVSFDATGRPLRMAGTGIDVTARKQAEEHRELLIHELNHRVKNTLATVQSFASQTLRNAANLAEARATFELRLVALSKAHDVLTQESWEGAGLRQIVANAISAYSDDRGGQRFETDGPELRLQPKSALALSMALHELATNAVKYGSLSNDVGRVRITWVSTPDTPPRFQLRWAESDGPPVEPPRRRGFGSRLVEQGLARELAGEVQLAFERQGLICTIEAPLVEVAWG